MLLGAYCAVAEILEAFIPRSPNGKKVKGRAKRIAGRYSVHGTIASLTRSDERTEVPRNRYGQGGGAVSICNSVDKYMARFAE